MCSLLHCRDLSTIFEISINFVKWNQALWFESQVEKREFTPNMADLRPRRFLQEIVAEQTIAMHRSVENTVRFVKSLEKKAREDPTILTSNSHNSITTDKKSEKLTGPHFTDAQCPPGSDVNDPCSVPNTCTDCSADVLAAKIEKQTSASWFHRSVREKHKNSSSNFGLVN